MGCFCSSSEKNFEEICIITTYFNPSKNKRRLQLHLDFVKRLSIYSGLQIVTVECSFKNNSFELSPEKYSKETIIQIKAENILWLKENLINIALKTLFKNKKFVKYCKYVIWSDDDIEFVDKNWAIQFKKSLKQYKIVQIFKEALFLDINAKILEKHLSFGYYYAEKRLQLSDNEYPHPGYIWGTTTNSLMKIGQIFDYGVLGNGDKHMAYALIGDYLKSFPNNITFNQNYKNSLRKWQEKAFQIFEKSVGYCDVTIKHHWHGSRKNRQHLYRWLLLSKFDFDPLELTVRNDGHYELDAVKKNNSEFIEKIEEYFIDRKEDDEKNDDDDENISVPRENKNYNKKKKVRNFFQNNLSKNDKKINKFIDLTLKNDDHYEQNEFEKKSYDFNEEFDINEDNLNNFEKNSNSSENENESYEAKNVVPEFKFQNNINKKNNYKNSTNKRSNPYDNNQKPRDTNKNYRQKNSFTLQRKENYNYPQNIIGENPENISIIMPPLPEAKQNHYKTQLEISKQPIKQYSNIFTMYHGTSEEAAALILKFGFNRSLDGMLGPGVYVSRDFRKAKNYIKQPHPVILKLKVDVGKAIIIDKQNHPLQKTWSSLGYDSAWVPPDCGMVQSGLEENCIYDPKRIIVKKLIRLYKPSYQLY